MKHMRHCNVAKKYDVIFPNGEMKTNTLVDWVATSKVTCGSSSSLWSRFATIRKTAWEYNEQLRLRYYSMTNKPGRPFSNAVQRKILGMPKKVKEYKRASDLYREIDGVLINTMIKMT